LLDSGHQLFTVISLLFHGFVAESAEAGTCFTKVCDSMAAVIQLLDEMEIDLCKKVNRLSRRSWLRTTFVVVSLLGDGGYWVAIGLGMLLVRGTVVLPDIIQIALTCAVGVLLYKQLKQRLVRERPYITDSDILLGTAPLDRYSFPSGHTLHAVSLTIMYTVVEPLMLIVTLPFAILVAASRIVLGLHYPSDVMAGALLGTLLAVSSTWLF
jgi:undecaprenyl-diphosphatase